MKMEIFILITIIAVVVYVITTLRIYFYLHERKLTKSGVVFINFYLFHYLETYKKSTREETGKVGDLFYIWVVSINTALVSALIHFIF